MTRTPIDPPMPMNPAGRAPRRRLAARVAWVALAVVLAGAGVGLGMYLRTPAPPPVDAALVDLVRFAVTEQFANLSPAEKAPYIDRLIKAPILQLLAAAEQAELTEEQKKAGMQHVMTAKVDSTMDEYFALPAGKERERFMDKLIDEQELRMKAMQAIPKVLRGPAGGPGGRPPGKPVDPGEMKNRIEKASPMRRAQTAQFVSDMVQRREARGLGAPR